LLILVAFKCGEKIPESVSEKSRNQVVDQTLKKQSQRRNYKPSPDYLWQKISYSKADISIWGKTGYFYFALT